MRGNVTEKERGTSVNKMSKTLQEQQCDKEAGGENDSSRGVMKESLTSQSTTGTPGLMRQRRVSQEGEGLSVKPSLFITHPKALNSSHE